MKAQMFNRYQSLISALSRLASQAGFALVVIGILVKSFMINITQKYRVQWILITGFFVTAILMSDQLNEKAFSILALTGLFWGFVGALFETSALSVGRERMY